MSASNEFAQPVHDLAETPHQRTAAMFTTLSNPDARARNAPKERPGRGASELPVDDQPSIMARGRILGSKHRGCDRKLGRWRS